MAVVPFEVLLREEEGVDALTVEEVAFLAAHGVQGSLDAEAAAVERLDRVLAQPLLLRAEP